MPDVPKTTILTERSKLSDRTKLIAKCFSILNDSVQISINAYAALGENRALLAAVTSKGAMTIGGIALAVISVVAAKGKFKGGDDA